MDSGEDWKAHRDGFEEVKEELKKKHGIPYSEPNPDPRTKYEQFHSSTETMRENEATCPYCGWKDRDSWELSEEGEIQCGSCEKDFYFTSEVERYFTTYKQKENGLTMQIIIHQDRPVLSDYRRDRQTIDTDSKMIEILFGDDRISIRQEDQVVSVFENETLITALHCKIKEG